jgi:hypothetical protein
MSLGRIDYKKLIANRIAEQLTPMWEARPSEPGGLTPFPALGAVSVPV